MGGLWKHNTIDRLTRIVSVQPCAETQHHWHTYKNHIGSTMCRNTTPFTHLQELYQFNHVRKHNTIDTLTRTISVRPCAEIQHDWHTYKNYCGSTMYGNTTQLTHLQELYRFDHVQKHNTIDTLTRTVSVRPCAETQHHWHIYKNHCSSTMCGNTTWLTHLQEPYRFDHVWKYNTIDTLTRTISVRPCAETQHHWHTYKNCISSTMCGNTTPLTHLQELYQFDHVQKHNTIDTLTRTVSVRPCAEIQHDWHTYKNYSGSTMCGNTTRLTHLQEPYRFNHVRKYNTIDTLIRTIAVQPCAETQHHWHTYKNRIGSTMCGNTRRLTHLQEPYRFDHVRKHNTIDTLTRTVSVQPCVETQHHWHTYKNHCGSTMCGNTTLLTHLQELYQFDHVRKHNTIDTLTRAVGPCADPQHIWLTVP